MQTHLETLEALPDFASDPSGRRLRRFLAAEQALAHAIARRRFLARLVVLLAIALGLLVAGAGPEVAEVAGLLLFVPFLAGFLLSAVAEQVWIRRVQDAEREIHVRRSQEDRHAR